MAVLLSYPVDFSDLEGQLTRRGLTRTNRRVPANGPLLGDYRLLDLQLVGRTAVGEWPLEARVDVVRNLGADDQRDGARFSLVLGSRFQPGGWEFGYSNQRIQRDAVLAAFNEDDWWFHSFTHGASCPGSATASTSAGICASRRFTSNATVCPSTPIASCSTSPHAGNPRGDLVLNCPPRSFNGVGRTADGDSRAIELSERRAHPDFVLAPGICGIGSDRANQIVLGGNGIAPHHARLEIDGRGLTLSVLDPARSYASECAPRAREGHRPPRRRAQCRHGADRREARPR